jgi:hypothetical protein
MEQTGRTLQKTIPKEEETNPTSHTGSKEGEGRRERRQQGLTLEGKEGKEQGKRNSQSQRMEFIPNRSEATATRHRAATPSQQ